MTAPSGLERHEHAPEMDVVVETPMGSRNRYEIDPESGIIRLDRYLYASARYPADYGYVEGTEAGDDEPLDALVLVDEPTFPGCRIRARSLGLLRMEDELGPDLKILALPVWDRAHEWSELEHVPEALLREIAHFFDIYKDLEPGRHSRIEGWEGRDRAEAEIQAARRRWAGARGAGAPGEGWR